MFSLTVPANLDSLAPIAAFVAAVAEDAGLSPRAAYRLRLAVDEISTNIIMYAYSGSTAPGTIDLRAELDEATVTVLIEDQGAPFDPRQVPPPPDLHLPPEQRRLGGLGVYLALRNLDHFDYDRRGDRNRSRLVMNRAPAPEE
jgi:anti-sigma regulatory factor (Ser/Thr protein kinase)